jgi:hypothetical protein
VLSVNAVFFLTIVPSTTKRHARASVERYDEESSQDEDEKRIWMSTGKASERGKGPVGLAKAATLESRKRSHKQAGCHAQAKT